MKTLMKVGLVLSFGFCALARGASSGEERLTLTGTVVDTNGAPVKDSTVFVFSAGPRVGAASFCPTCYPDCRKSDVTKANGEFTIKELDPKLLFKILVVGKNYRPSFLPKTDPLKHAKVTVTPRLEEAKPYQSLRGRILSPDGEPIARAVVEFDMFFGQESNCGGQCEGVDLVAVTDDQGAFYIGSEKKFDWMNIRVEAPMFARKKFFRLTPDKVHDLKLSEGAMVTGQIVRNGKPAKGVGVGLVSVDRSQNFTGNFDTHTDAAGRFTFFNVPPNQDYYAYSLIGTAQLDDLVTPVMNVRVTGDGTTKDLGDMELKSGIRVHGKVILSDGKQVPPNTQLLIGRNQAWDARNVVLLADGSFDLRGLPTESISLGASLPNYRLSEKNKNLDKLNGGSSVGRIERDTYVELLLEPGDFQHPDMRNLPRDVDWIPKDKPLRGAEEPEGSI